MDSNKTAGEEARRQLLKNAASNLEQVLAATPHKTPTVRPPASYHKKLFKLDEPDMQDTAGEAGTNSKVIYSYGPQHMAVQKQDDQHEHKFSNYVRIQDVVLKTYLRRWTIGKSGERRSGISVLPVYIYIVIHRQICFVLSELISVARQYLPVAGIETRLTQTPSQNF